MRAACSGSVLKMALSLQDGRILPRVAGHIAYWFAWDNYVGDLGEVYGG